MVLGVFHIALFLFLFTYICLCSVVLCVLLHPCRALTNSRRERENVILEIFAVVNNLWLKEIVKIKNSKILFELIFTTANIYRLLKPQMINYSQDK